MKTFSTSGTGSGQTLSEIESEVIPCYNNEADADADLSNLEDEQIFGVEETSGNTEGYQYPVNVVESGNMHSVTSNAVANLFNEYTSLSVAESASFTATRKGLYYIRIVSACGTGGSPDNVYLNDKLINVCATLKTGADSYNMLMVTTLPVFMKVGDVLSISQVQSSTYSKIQPLGVFYL